MEDTGLIRIRKMVREVLSKYIKSLEIPYHIIVIVNSSEQKKLHLLEEGKWKPSGEKGYWERVDKPKFNHDQLHVHIAKQKHINTKSKQVAWNEDGTRHDRKSFNNNFDGIEKAKNIARKSLDLSPDATLENLDTGNGLLLLESIEYLPERSSVYIFRYNGSGKSLLKG